MSVNVLVVGNGGREHALAWKLRQSPQLGRLLVAPGNAGTATVGDNIAVRADDVAGLRALAERERINLVVVGPEVALAAGLADALAEAGIRCFGPTRRAARIESSKAWSKQLMRRAGVPTAPFELFTSAEAAHAFLAHEPWERWRVVKQDGLAAGKGVVVALSEQAVHTAIEQLAIPGSPLLLEAPLVGEEISLLALCDGHTAVPLVSAQDHKRLNDGDQGPNTGGMGAYAPVPHVSTAQVAALQQTVFAPVLRVLAAEGMPFTGVLYAGLMLTADGPQVLEFNARFGDPETQVLLPLLQSDLLELLLACVEGRLVSEMVRWHSGAALGVVLAAAGYPANPRTGDRITMPEPSNDVLVFHAGTTHTDGALVTNGGRVLTIVGHGSTLEAAHAAAYGAVAAIKFGGKQWRTDIGGRVLTMDRKP